MRYVLAGLLAIVFAFPAVPAEMRRDGGADGIDLISVRGVLDEGDDALMPSISVTARAPRHENTGHLIVPSGAKWGADDPFDLCSLCTRRLCEASLLYDSLPTVRFAGP